MVSHENEVMILLGVAAVILLASISTFTNLPTWISIAVVVVVGVLIPQFISREDELLGSQYLTNHRQLT